MAREVKRRRKSSVSADTPVTIKERRALDRSNIEKIIKENKILLTPWSEILAACLREKEPQPFMLLKSVSDFIDGFQLFAPSSLNALTVR